MGRYRWHDTDDSQIQRRRRWFVNATNWFPKKLWLQWINMSTAHFKNQNPARVFLYPCISEQSVVLCTAVTSISPTLKAPPGGREWICIYCISPSNTLWKLNINAHSFKRNLDLTNIWGFINNFLLCYRCMHLDVKALMELFCIFLSSQINKTAATKQVCVLPFCVKW